MANKDREKEQERKRALHDLNPVEDVKGAIEFVKDLDPVDEIKDALERAAEVLDPRQSDVRVVRPEEDTRSETVRPERE